MIRFCTLTTISFALLAASAPAQDALVEQVREELASLDNYGVFDNISFQLNGGTVTLSGQASQPQLKKQAEKVVRRIEGVQQVTNEIEALPNSSEDDRIRTLAYIQIYGHPSLSRYNPNFGTPLFDSLVRRTFGLTQDPPPGNHPIHIVVKNNQITLEGVVDTEGDKTVAGMQANSVNGAMKVTNNLRVGNEKSKSG